MWIDYQYNDAVSNQNAINMDLIMESTRETKIDFLFLPVYRNGIRFPALVISKNHAYYCRVWRNAIAKKKFHIIHVDS